MILWKKCVLLLNLPKLLFYYVTKSFLLPLLHIYITEEIIHQMDGDPWPVTYDHAVRGEISHQSPGVKGECSTCCMLSKFFKFRPIGAGSTKMQDVGLPVSALIVGHIFNSGDRTEPSIDSNKSFL